MDKLINSEIHQTIKTYSLFLSKAKRYIWDSRIDEGFLHYLMAIDLVFGEKESLTKSIINRTSVIVYNKFGKDFDMQKRIIQRIYDARSEYVHSGHGVDESLIAEVEKICEEILHCFLRLQRKDDNHTPGFVSVWLKRLDLIAAVIRSKFPVENNDFEESGIDRGN